MLSTLPLILALALPLSSQYVQRKAPKPPLPGYGFSPSLPTTPFTERRPSLEPSRHLMRQPRSRDERSSRIAWLQENCSPVAGVLPWPAGREDFSDLGAFGQAIQGRRIVTLGEASHSDGAAFRIKARLVRFLYQECDFDLLVFEAGLFDCDAAWRKTLEGEELTQAGLLALQPIWSRSQTVHDLFAWMQTTLDSERPLQLAGMDLMPTSRHMDQAHSDITQLGLALGVDADVLGEGLVVLEDFPTGYREALGIKDEELEFLLGGLLEVGQALEQAAAADDIGRELLERAAFYVQFIKSFANAIHMSARTDWSKPGGDSTLNLRDKQMAANVEWLAKVAYPEAKIIVWGATSHLSRARSGLNVKTAPGMVPLGEHLDRSMPGQVYHLGITAYAGSIGNALTPGATPLEPAQRGSLEELLHATEMPAAFLDLAGLKAKTPWLTQDLSMRAMGHGDVLGNWAQALDGVYYVTESLPVIHLAD